MMLDDLVALIGRHPDPYHVGLLWNAETFVGRRGVWTIPAAARW